MVLTVHSTARVLASGVLTLGAWSAAFAQTADPIEVWLRLNGGGKRNLFPSATKPSQAVPAPSAPTPAQAEVNPQATPFTYEVVRPYIPNTAQKATQPPAVAPPPAVATSQAAAPVQFQVEKFEVSGNTLVADSQVQKALARYTGKQDLTGVNNAVDAVKALYQAAGYAAVVVSLPEQTIADGTVRINVIEGKLGQVLVSGQSHFSRDNILASVPSLHPGTTPNLVWVDTEAQLANENPAKNIRVVFQPGMKTGEVDALVSATEQPPQQWTLSADNTGRPSQGTVRSALSYQHANVMDKDHVLKLRLETSLSRPSDNVVTSGSYRVPLYGHPASVEFTASYSNARNRATPTAAGDLNFSGQGTSFGARYQWNVPRSGETRHQFAVGMDMRHYNNTCTIGNLGSEGCGNAGASVGVRPVTFSYIANNPGLFNAGVHLSGNLLPGGHHGNAAAFEASRPGATARYWVLRGNWQSTHQITEQQSIGVRASAQQTPHALVSAEQFGVGGVGTVRGYQERELVGDQGLAASLEWTSNLTSVFASSQAVDKPDAAAAGLWQQWFPEWGLPSGHSLHGSVFLDAGQVSNRLGTACMPGSSRCSLAGVGVGLQWAGNRRWLLRTDLARALKAGPTTPNGDTRLHVSYSLVF